jgi:amino acid transporter
MNRKLNGHSVGELPFRAAFGIYGSYLAVGLNIMCLAAQFYVALFPIGGAPPDASDFFQAYLAAPVILFLYLVWKVYSWFFVPEHRPLYVPLSKIDIYAGIRQGQLELISGEHLTEGQRRESVLEIAEDRKMGAKGYVKSVVGALF